MKFADVPAHEYVKEQLRALADSDRIPHALLLEGPAGIGKMMLARAFAQYIHCPNHTPDGDSCGVCPSCRQHQSFNHIDTHFSFPIIRRKNSSSAPNCDDWIETWRNFLTDSPFMDFTLWQEMLGNPNGQPIINVEESQSIIRKLNYTSHASKYIVTILWLPEKMNTECANKLLKLIEEPHTDTIFILVSNNPGAILPTIYSRLRRIEMKRLPDSYISDWLVDNFAIDRPDADTIAHLAEGSVLEARKRIDTRDSDAALLDLFMSLMRNGYVRNVKALKEWADTVAGLGREKSIKFLNYCERMIGENFISNLHNPSLVYMDSAEAKFSSRFAPFINEKNVQQLRKLFIDGRNDIAGNANAKIVLFDIAVRVILLIKYGNENRGK